MILDTAEKWLMAFKNLGFKYTDKEIIELMNRYAQYHVDEALTKAANNAELQRDAGQDLYGISVDKESIINAYPLTKIK